MIEIVSRSSTNIRAAAALDVDGAWSSKLPASEVKSKSTDDEDKELIDSAIVTKSKLQASTSKTNKGVSMENPTQCSDCRFCGTCNVDYYGWNGGFNYV